MRDIYARKSQWKWYLAAGGTVIVIISLMYTRYLAIRLAEREDQQAQQFAEAMETIVNPDTLNNTCDLTLHGLIIQGNTTIPVVIIDEAGFIEAYRNIDDNNLEEMDTAVVRLALNRMIEQGADTIAIIFPPDISKLLIYSHSRLLALLNWYPYIQLFLIAVFIAFGYLGFSAARRAEENQVWLGMAKETAHQLGTPISAILGWIEALKGVNEDHEVNQEMLAELDKDVMRLELVADRFSKIGSQPELKPVNLYAELDECRAYMQRRAPRKCEFAFPDPADHPPLLVNINSHLFDWVIENLLRNAIDAMEGGAGRITAEVYEEGPWACVDVSDTGKGIAAGKFSTVFKPGYSTKTRGWGLGLSLSKRIVEQYHRGKLFVKRSEPGKGTTFTVKLLKNTNTPT
jgi:signal transduction histidine kinase